MKALIKKLIALLNNQQKPKPVKKKTTKKPSKGKGKSCGCK